MQFPLTKQDSYANAIYSGQVRRGVRKQGSYEQAIEVTRNAQAAIGQMQQSTGSGRIRKQDSYNKAIGGSFEDQQQQQQQQQGRAYCY